MTLKREPTGGGSSTPTPVFQTLYDLDFTAQPNQVINAAVATIAGVNWTVTDNVNLGGQIINGTGLRFAPTVGANVATGIAVRIGDLAGNDFKKRIRAWVRMTRTPTTVGAGANNYDLFGIWWNGNTNLASGSSERTYTGHQSPIAGVQAWTSFPYGSVLNTNNYAASAGDDALLLDYDGLGTCGCFSGVYAADFPVVSRMRMRVLDGGITPIFAQNPPRELEDMVIAFYVQSQDANFTTTITRLLIQTAD